MKTKRILYPIMLFVCIGMSCQALAQQNRSAQDPGPPAGPSSANRGGDVLSFGADPTGARNSAPAFEQAIKANLSLAIPPGTYRFERPVVLRSGANITATPDTVTLIAAPGNDAPGGALIFVGTNVANISVSGITFDGNVSAIKDPHKRLVYFNGADHVVFDHVKFQNAAGQGLTFSGVGDRPVVSSGVRHSVFANIGLAWKDKRDWRLTDTATAVTFSNGSATTNLGNFADDNNFSMLGQDAVDVHAQGHFEASGNHIEESEKGWRPTRATAVSYGIAGFYIYYGSDDVKLINNYVEGGTGNCIDIADSSHIVVKGNTIKDCGGAGISLGRVREFEIVDNQIINTNTSAHYEIENKAHMGAISLSCGRQPCRGALEGGIIHGNTVEHSVPGRRQAFGIWVQNGVALQGVEAHENKTSAGQSVEPAYER